MPESTRLATFADSSDSNPVAIVERSYTRDQIELAKRTIAKGATDDELVMFLARCKSTGLDPWDRQVYFLKRNSKDGPVVTIQVGIDGLRAIAERTGEYVGSDEPEYEGEVKHDGKPVPELARVRVTREIRGKDRTFVGVARWAEFVPSAPLDFMWKKMPRLMLGKTAEAQALRKAFPRELAGLAAHEESQSLDGVVVGMDAARALPKEPQFLERVDPKTGEVTMVRAADEYERMYVEKPASPADQMDQLADQVQAGQAKDAAQDADIPPWEEPAQPAKKMPVADAVRPSNPKVAARIDAGLCSHPECIENDTTNKAAEGTNPGRCLLHLS